MATSKRKYKKAAKTRKKTERQAGKQYKKGAKMVVRGEKQKRRAGTATSRGVSKLRKTGEIGKGARKSPRFRAGGAAHKITTGTKMMEAAARKKKATGPRKMKRRAPGAVIGKPRKTVTRRGRIT